MKVAAFLRAFVTECIRIAERGRRRADRRPRYAPMLCQFYFTFRGLAAALGAIMPAVAAAQSRASSEAAAFIDVAVLPMDRERLLEHQTVVVLGDRIVAVGPVAAVMIPPDASRIDGRGKFLIPGLADMHVHTIERSFDSVPLWRHLAQGVTTVRSMHGGRGPGSTPLRLKRAVERNELLGPRIYVAGDIWVTHKNLGLPSGDEPSAPWPDSASAVFQHAREVSAAYADSAVALRRDGYDFVKLYAFPHPAYDSVVAGALRAGLPVVGHVPSDGFRPGVEQELSRVLRDRWASIEHLTGYFSHLTGMPEIVVANLMADIRDTAAFAQPGYHWDAREIRDVAVRTRDAGVWNCPTLTVLRAFSSMWGNDTTARSPSWAGRPTGPPWLRSYMALQFRLVKALQEAGAGLLLGTDGLYTVAEELRLMVDGAGLTPYEALLTGTRNAAEFLGTLDSTGTIAVGKRADLVLLDANPLHDIRAAASLAGVMVGGRWLDRSELEALLQLTP